MYLCVNLRFMNKNYAVCDETLFEDVASVFDDITLEGGDNDNNDEIVNNDNALQNRSGGNEVIVLSGDIKKYI